MVPKNFFCWLQNIFRDLQSARKHIISMNIFFQKKHVVVYAMCPTVPFTVRWNVWRYGSHLPLFQLYIIIIAILTVLSGDICFLQL